MQEISQGMAKVNSLAVELGNYYKSHASPENQKLSQVAVMLIAYNLALDFLIGHATFGEIEIKKLIEILEPVNPSEAALLRQVNSEIRQVVIPSHLMELRDQYGNHLMSDLNIAVDLGRRLLKARELKDQGMLEQDVQKFLASWKTKNIF